MRLVQEHRDAVEVMVGDDEVLPSVAVEVRGDAVVRRRVGGQRDLRSEREAAVAGVHRDREPLGADDQIAFAVGIEIRAEGEGDATGRRHEATGPRT